MLPVTKWLALYKHRRRAKDERRAPAINPSGFRIRRENEEVPYKRKGQWSAGNVMGPGCTDPIGAVAGRVYSLEHHAQKCSCAPGERERSSALPSFPLWAARLDTSRRV